MKLDPKIADDSVNLSVDHPLKDFLYSVLQIILLLGFVYISLGGISDYLAPQISLETERKYLGFLSKSKDESDKYNEVNLYLEDLKNNLLLNKKEKELISISFHCSKESNAFALPGGHILINSQTLNILKSENALSYIIAHEIGHIVNRDIIKGMGRSLLLSMMLSLFSMGENVIELGLNFVKIEHSKSREAAADLYAKKLVTALYGHLGGSNEFFEYHLKKEGGGFLDGFFSSHPALKSRLNFKGGYSENLKKVPGKFKNLCHKSVKESIEEPIEKSITP